MTDTELNRGAGIQIRCTVNAGVAEVAVKAVHIERHVQILAVPAPVCIKEAGLGGIQECIEFINAVLATIGAHGIEQVVLVVLKLFVFTNADLAIHLGSNGQIRHGPLGGGNAGLLVIDLIGLGSVVLIIVSCVYVLIFVS